MPFVKAIERGYDNVAVREPGDVFEVPKDFKAPWAVPVKKGDEPAAADGAELV